MTFKHYARLIRLPNLLIVVLTQCLLNGQLFEFTDHCLPSLQFGLLVLSTVLIAGSGYVINDIEDWEIDAVNKPEHKRIVGRVVTVAWANRFYWSLVGVGFAISLYLAIYIQDIVQLLLYPLAVGLLWAYSRWFKRQPLIGNVVVSFFCAFVAGIVWYAQKNCLIESEEGSLFFYMYLAFFSTLFREIVKDIEDVEGDTQGNCRTLPIVIGVIPSKVLALVVMCAFLLPIFAVNYMLWLAPVVAIFDVFVVLPSFWAIYWLFKAQEKKDYARLSLLAKIIMLSGIIFLLVI